MRVNLVSRAGSVALCAAAVAMCAITGALTASGSSSEYAWLEAVVRMLTVAAPIAVGLFALHRPPFERFGALLLVAGFVWFLTTLANAENADALQHRAGLALGVRAAAGLPAAGVPDRPARQPPRPGAGRGPSVLLVLTLYLPTALLVEQLSGARAGDELRRRLSRERVHGQRIGAGRHRGPRAPAAGDPHDRALRGGRRAARAAHPQRDPPHAPRRSRPCWPWRAFAARPSRGASSARRLAPESARPRGRRCGCSRSRCR